MDAIVMAIDPVLLQIGPVTIRWYGLMIACGIAMGIYIALREARRRGIGEEQTYNCAMWGVMGAIVGARLVHVVDRIDFYLQNPASILAIQQGGLAIWGGVLGGIGAGALYCRLAGLPVARVADVAAPAMLLGQIVGRLGCLINGDAYGAPVDLPWSIMYVHQDALIPDLGEYTHPYPLYEIAWNVILLGFLWRMRRGSQADGVLFLAYLILYSLGRVLLTFVRQETVVALGLQQAQLLGLIVIALAAPLLLWRRRLEVPAAVG
jgi:phosphatidylglycerol---prolipoprotein diacylglyceryl transferase